MKITLTISLTMLLGVWLMILPASFLIAQTGNSQWLQITSGPVIESADDHSATIAWSTNRRGSSRVTYGTDPNNLTQLGEAPWGQGGLTHRVELKNLQPNTTYYFRVETGQAQGTGGEVESETVQSFTTRSR